MDFTMIWDLIGLLYASLEWILIGFFFLILPVVAIIEWVRQNFAKDKGDARLHNMPGDEGKNVTNKNNQHT